MSIEQLHTIIASEVPNLTTYTETVTSSEGDENVVVVQLGDEDELLVESLRSWDNGLSDFAGRFNSKVQTKKQKRTAYDKKRNDTRPDREAYLARKREYGRRRRAEAKARKLAQK